MLCLPVFCAAVLCRDVLCLLWMSTIRVFLVCLIYLVCVRWVVEASRHHPPNPHSRMEQPVATND